MLFEVRTNVENPVEEIVGILKKNRKSIIIIGENAFNYICSETFQANFSCDSQQAFSETRLIQRKQTKELAIDEMTLAFVMVQIAKNEYQILEFFEKRVGVYFSLENEIEEIFYIK